MTVTQEQIDAQDAANEAYGAFADLDEQIAELLQRAQAAKDEAQAALDAGNHELAEQKLAESLRYTEDAIRLIRERIGG